MSVPARKMSLHEYIEWENAQPDRNEYYRGEVFAMVGGRRTHGQVVVNLVRELSTALRGASCRVFSEGMKVQVADEAILYPDVFVTCDRADLTTDMVFRSPIVVVEVLSPTTQAYDRGLKFSLYRRIATLREYVLVDPDTRRVEAFRRGSDDLWVLHDMSDEAVLAMPAIEVVVPLAEIFDGLELAR